MQAADGKRFRDLIRGMGRMFGQEPDALILDAYWLALGKWSMSEFESAAAHLMQTSKFMPRPADFHELRKAGRPTAGEAFAKAIDHAASSAYRNGPLGEPLIDRCVRAIGGYIAIAMCEEDKLHFLGKRFAEHFETMQDAEDVREAVPTIAGPPQHKALSGPTRLRDLLPRDEFA